MRLLNLEEGLQGIGRRLSLQDPDQAGAGVLGVEVDLSRHQGAEADHRAAQTRAPLDGDLGARLDQLGEDLGEHPPLGVLLAAHDEGAEKTRRCIGIS